MGRGVRGCGSRVEGRGLWVRVRGGRGGYEGNLILHVTVVGYAVMVYWVAVDCGSKTTYTGRPDSLADPRQTMTA